MKIKKGYKNWKGKSSTDMPQELFRESDFYEVEIMKRHDEVEFLQLRKIDWSEVRYWKRAEQSNESKMQKRDFVKKEKERQSEFSLAVRALPEPSKKLRKKRIRRVVSKLRKENLAGELPTKRPEEKIVRKKKRKPLKKRSK